MKPASPAESAEDCHASVPAGRQEILRALHGEILKAAPSLAPGICHGMIGYGIGPRQTASGCDGDWCKVGLANQKHHVSLYLCGGDADGHLVERRAARLGKISTGKSCIRFTKLENLNLVVAMELVGRVARTA